MYYHNVLSQCIITMYYHNVLSQCIITMYYHNVLSIYVPVNCLVPLSSMYCWPAIKVVNSMCELNLIIVYSDWDQHGAL